MRYIVCIFFVLLLLMNACVSHRSVPGSLYRSKPEIIETGYNLVRARLRVLGLLDKVEVTMDTNFCTHWKVKHFGGDWLRELLNIGEEEEDIQFKYSLRAVGKSYFNGFGDFTMKNARNIFHTSYEYDSKRAQLLCKETAPDTALKRVYISEYFLHSLDSNYVSMKFEEALDIVRATFGLDTSFRCASAAPDYAKLKYDSDEKTPIWYVTVELMPSDTIVYYNMKTDTRLSQEEIINKVNARQKTDGSCRCPEFVLRARINVQDKRVFQASLQYRVLSDLIIEPAPEHLSAIEAMFDERIRKWREANADYIKSKQ